MALHKAVEHVPLGFLFFVTILSVAFWLASYRYNGLSSIPGPFVASFSNLWQLCRAWRGLSYRNIELHKKYKTKVLRVGPNTVSVSDAKEIRRIYGYNPAWKKSEFYDSFSYPASDGTIITNLASTTDYDQHTKLKRPIANAFSMTSVLQYEPLVDKTMGLFLHEVDQRFVQPGLECPLDVWLQMLAFDLIGEITFSSDLGFLRSGRDVDEMMESTRTEMEERNVMGHIPRIDRWIRVNNPLRRIGAGGKIVSFTMKHLQKHLTHPGALNHSPDLVTKFMAAREKYPETITEKRLHDYTNIMIAAGSDGTAIILKALVWEILTHPDAYQKIMDEIRVCLAQRSSEDLDRYISWREASNMAFFQACVKETLRYRPANGETLPRVVPPGGATICGHFMPAGTNVGCNPFVVSQDESVFGKDVDVWRPERWLDGDAAKYMEPFLFAFGAGPRICIGKYVSLLEINKFIPELFRKLEITVVDPRRYHDVGGFLVTQRGMDVRLSKIE